MNNIIDEERFAINKILNDLKEDNKEFGNYVHHYYLNSYYIIIKLTNGYFKISKRLLESVLNSVESPINAAHFKRALDSFVKVNLF